MDQHTKIPNLGKQRRDTSQNSNGSEKYGTHKKSERASISDWTHRKSSSRGRKSRKNLARQKRKIRQTSSRTRTKNEGTMMTKVLQNLLKTLEEYLTADGVNEVVINREREVWLDKGGGWHGPIFDARLTTKFLKDFCIELANSREMRFNEDFCSLSCAIPQTRYRVQALHSVILRDSDIALSIRVPNSNIFPIENFLISPNIKTTHDDLKRLISERKNVLISGGTGSGKTSFLNALLRFVDRDDRIVTIEDSEELFVENPNRTQILVPKIDTKSMSYELALNSAMRLRPDRILLGEIDTKNTMTYLRLSNTGHSGMLSTLHANSPADAIHAIINNAMFGSQPVAESIMRGYIKSAIDVIIQIKREGKSRIISDILNLKEALS